MVATLGCGGNFRFSRFDDVQIGWASLDYLLTSLTSLFFVSQFIGHKLWFLIRFNYFITRWECRSIDCCFCGGLQSLRGLVKEEVASRALVLVEKGRSLMLMTYESLISVLHFLALLVAFGNVATQSYCVRVVALEIFWDVEFLLTQSSGKHLFCYGTKRIMVLMYCLWEFSHRTYGLPIWEHSSAHFRFSLCSVFIRVDFCSGSITILRFCFVWVALTLVLEVVFVSERQRGWMV